MNTAIAGALGAWEGITARLRGIGQWLPPLVLRLVMGWEFFESGREKLLGDNWFAEIKDRFPFPFNHLPAGFSWTLSTWTELAGAVLLWLGLGTRVAAFALLFVTFVATAAVHWPDMISMWSDLAKGYAITDMGYGNFKLPLLFVVMLLPLMFQGPGYFSLDALLARLLHVDAMPSPRFDARAWALAAVLLGACSLMLLPMFGFALLAVAAALLIAERLLRA